MSQALAVNQVLDSPEVVTMFDHLEQLVARSETDHTQVFETYLNEYADLAGKVINTFIPVGSHPDMGRYLYDPLTAYSENGGKRHRPLICVAAAHAVGGDHRRAFSSGAAIEHFHTAALIHDDIADDAELRRGEPCMHLRIGEGLESTMLCLYGTTPFTRSVASRMSNLSTATNPNSKVMSADSLLVDPDESTVFVQILVGDEEAADAIPIVEYEPVDTLAVRLKQAYEMAKAHDPFRLALRLPAEGWLDAGEARSAQHYAIVLLDAFCTALDTTDTN